jgi:hypothetical protein
MYINPAHKPGYIVVAVFRFHTQYTSLYEGSPPPYPREMKAIIFWPVATVEDPEYILSLVTSIYIFNVFVSTLRHVWQKQYIVLVIYNLSGTF